MVNLVDVLLFFLGLQAGVIVWFLIVWFNNAPRDPYDDNEEE